MKNISFQNNRADLGPDIRFLSNYKTLDIN